MLTFHDANSALPLPDNLLGINYYDENYRSDENRVPSFAEIETKLKELGA